MTYNDNFRVKKTLNGLTGQELFSIVFRRFWIQDETVVYGSKRYNIKPFYYRYINLVPGNSQYTQNILRYCW